jgi:hypothetical protein
MSDMPTAVNTYDMSKYVAPHQRNTHSKPAGSTKTNLKKLAIKNGWTVSGNTQVVVFNKSKQFPTHTKVRKIVFNTSSKEYSMESGIKKNYKMVKSNVVFGKGSIIPLIKKELASCIQMKRTNRSTL